MTQVRESETSRGESSKCRRNSMMDAAMTYAVVNKKYVYNLASLLLFFQATRSSPHQLLLLASDFCAILAFLPLCLRLSKALTNIIRS